MHATTSAIESEAHITRRKKWPQKVRRELGRLVMHVKTLALRPVALTTSSQFVFILGHMRSGSTLLCHLLCDSDDIIGFGEAHHDYRRRSDLARLLVSVSHYTGKPSLRYRYVLDKIVSTKDVLDAAVLTDRRIRYVFLIREPAASVASIVAMRRHFHPDETSQQVLAFAAKHYQDRLAQLLQYAETIDDRDRCLLVTHRQLLGETSVTFGALERFLDLRAPLREAYEVRPTTGQPGFGDPSPNIRLGKIDRSLPKKHVDLPAPIRVQLEQCYQSCIDKFRATIQSTGAVDLATCKRAA